jgi:hypothetical protein
MRESSRHTARAVHSKAAALRHGKSAPDANGQINHDANGMPLRSADIIPSSLLPDSSALPAFQYFRLRVSLSCRSMSSVFDPCFRSSTVSKASICPAASIGPHEPLWPREFQAKMTSPL